MSAIKAGDLVMVVKPAPCCGSATGIGRVFVVALVESGEGWKCGSCGRPASAVAIAKSQFVHLMSRLIRIDPPAQPESVETEREVTA